MSLPAYQQRVLDSIETTLQTREPRLTSMFAMFTRLNRQEGVPRTERLAAEPRWARSRLRRVRRSTAAVRAMFLIPLAVMLVAFAVFLGMSTSRPPCPPANGPHALVAGQSHPTNCQQVTGSKGFGHGP